METETSWDVRSYHLSLRLLVLVRNVSDKDKRGTVGMERNRHTDYLF